MATNTPNLNLVKPEMSDYADIRVLNNNMDILDEYLFNLRTKNYPNGEDDKVLTLDILKQYLGEGAVITSKIFMRGYILLKNGVQINWGTFDNVPNGGKLTFSIPFKNECWVVVGNDVNKSSVNNQVHSFSNYSTTNVTVYTQRANGTVATSAYGRYIAIGY